MNVSCFEDAKIVLKQPTKEDAVIKRLDHRRNRRANAREELVASEANDEIEFVLNDRAICLHEEQVAAVNQKRFNDRIDRESREIYEDLDAARVLEDDLDSGSFYDEGDWGDLMEDFLFEESHFLDL